MMRGNAGLFAEVCGPGAPHGPSAGSNGVVPRLIASRRAKALAVVFVFMILLMPLFGAAHAADAEAVIKGIRERYGRISAISADFVQESIETGLGRTTVTSGTVYFKKPGKMRWIYTVPAGEEIISNGKKLWIYQPDLYQAIETDARAGASSVATDLLGGGGDLEKDFFLPARLEGEDRAVYTIALRPRGELGENLREIFIEVDKKEFLIRRTVVRDPFGVETRVALDYREINPKIEDAFFEFTPKKGVTIIRP